MKKCNISKKSVFLIVLIILCTCTIVISGEGTSINVNNEVAYRGETVTFQATISESIEVGSGALELSYDDSVLELLSGTCNVSNAVLSNF